MTLIMGVLNVTPDSFSDGGKFLDPKEAVRHAKQMVAEGADIIDIGGESTKPGAAPVGAEEEIARLKPVFEALAKEVSVPLSIDTYKSEVAEACLALGAKMINDVTGLRDPRMAALAAQWNVPVVIMHMKGDPQNMQKDPTYIDVVREVKTFLEERAQVAIDAGVAPGNVIVDPGIGFGKTLEHNLEILRHLDEFKKTGFMLLVGPSRKSFIGAITGLPSEERTEGTIAASVIAAMNGADIVRVHDVRACKRALMVADAIKGHGK